ncbi:MAG: SLC13 family permease [bacterium]
MNLIKKFLQQDAVLNLALLAAMLSAFWIPPSLNYYHYINFNVLFLLFCLMSVVAGLHNLGCFYFLGVKLLHRVKNSKLLSLILVYLCFFSSMLITNDVALLTFVPFTISLLKMINQENMMIRLIVLETIAANLGSMLTPWGNPQNLYLYSLTDLTVMRFIVYLLPLTGVSLFLLTALILSSANLRVQLNAEFFSSYQLSLDKRKLFLYIFLFLLSLLSVARLIPSLATLIIVVLLIGLYDRKILQQVDYLLLLTFFFFFIFTGNIKQIPQVNAWLSELIGGNECLVGVVISQLISNVPAAMLLSGFTASYQELIYGVNIGGLGTMIASMASLISYRYYIKEQSSKKGKYILLFTVYNTVFLLILLLTYYCCL